MGRGKGLIEQSQKKPKNPQMKQEVNFWWKFPEVPNQKNSVFLSKDFLEALKRMEPKEVVDILLK